MKRWYITSFFIIIFLIITIIMLLKILQQDNSIKLNGNKEITIKLNEEYIEQGIKNDKDNKVKITGKVDNAKVGEYKINYKLGNKETTRIVKVIDDVNPTIDLNGPKDIYLYIGKEYYEFGASANDNYDGDLTNKIEIKNSIDNTKIGDYKIDYIIKDSSNNQAKTTRNVHVIEYSESASIAILMYHFFYDSTKDTAIDNNWIDINKFEEQIKYLKDNNYYFPTWKEIDLYLDKKIKLPDKSIVITADDGDPSFFNLATKILEKYNVPATSFMVTSWYHPDGYTFNKNLISIESHTHDMHKGGCKTGHKGLFQCIDEEKGINDLKTSISVTKSNMVFCYPFGDVNEREKQMLKKVNFTLAVTTEFGKIKPGMDKLELPRIRVSGKSSLQFFIKSIN